MKMVKMTAEDHEIMMTVSIHFDKMTLGFFATYSRLALLT